MKVLISGATGMVGSKLTSYLSAGGHEIASLVRSTPAPGTRQIPWDPAAGKLDAASLEGLDAVVHLAGENVGAGRWTAARKARIRQSRIDGTTLLARTLGGLAKPPKVLVSASAVGVYGNRGSEELTEKSSPGSGFLAEVCQQWEATTAAASDAGIRVVNLRIGVVLSPDGGALGKMLLPFKMGVGGNLGSGEQYMSWIAIDDLLGIILHAIDDDALSGPVNATAPCAVTNAEFTKTLGRVLGRPTVLPVPAVALRLLLGEMAEEMLLASTRVKPERLAGEYEYRHPDLEGALRHVLGR